MSNWKLELKDELNYFVSELEKDDMNIAGARRDLYVKIHSAVDFALESAFKEIAPSEFNNDLKFPAVLEKVSEHYSNFSPDLVTELSDANLLRNSIAHPKKDKDGRKIYVDISERDVKNFVQVFQKFVSAITDVGEGEVFLTWICLNCKTENSITSRYCSACKFDYVAHEEELRIKEKKLHKEKLNQERKDRGVELCPSCGMYENPVAARYCGSCSADILIFKEVPSAQKLARASLIISLSPAVLFCFFCVINASAYIFFPIVMMLGFVSFVVGLLSVFKLLRLRISLSYVLEAFLGMFIGSAELILPAVVLGYLLLNRFPF